jgi:ferredoxin, 2Fe-2S
MYSVTYVSDDGTRREVNVADGESVMQGALNNMVSGIVGECGGALACATCHCYIDEAWMGRAGPATGPENDMLDSTSSPRKANSRLGCQIAINASLDGLVVHLPPDQY